MAYNSRPNPYRENAVLGSSPEQLVRLLYEHLLVNLARGALLIRAGDIEGKATALGRASDILFELLESLDFEAGGDVAPRLAALYGFFLEEVSASGRAMDADRLDRMGVLVERLHGAWTEAADDPSVRMARAEGA